MEDIDPTAHAEKYRISFIDAQEHAYYARYVEDGTEVRVIDHDGAEVRKLRWPGVLGVVPSPFESQLVGIAHGPGDDFEDQSENLPASWQDGPRYPWRLVLIDIDSGETRPIADLQPLGLAPGGRIRPEATGQPSADMAQLMLQVDVLELVVPGDAIFRVNTPGSCLFVREAPNESAPEFDCYADGVLLGARDTADEGDWVAVRTPDGHDGWASADFFQQ